jgi:hypothetical protein
MAINNSIIFVDRNIRLKLSKSNPINMIILANIDIRNKVNMCDRLVFPANEILSETLRIPRIVCPGRKLQIRIEGMSLNHDQRGILLQSATSMLCLGVTISIDIDIR